MGFINFSKIKDCVFDENQYLPTGITELDKAIIGLGMGQLVVITGTRASGKTTFIGQIICNFINNGYSGLLCSFEMSNPRLKKWLTAQALGRSNLRKEISVTGKEYFEPKNEYVKYLVEKWIGNKLEVYENLSFNVNDVSNDIKARLEANKDIRFIILDNLMKLGVDTLKDNKYEAQSILIKQLQTFAQQRNICLILVAHPNKIRTLPRIDDVGGSGDIINAADTVLLIHRVNGDFKVRAKEYFGWEENYAGYDYSNMIEIAKDREFGNDGNILGVFFEPQAKRFLNYKGENIHYGWERNGKQTSFMQIADDEQSPF